MYEVETKTYCKMFQGTFDDLSKMGTMVSVCERELKSNFPECVHFSNKAYFNIYGDPYYSKNGTYPTINRIAVVCTAYTQIPTYSEEIQRYIESGGVPAMLLVPDQYIKHSGITYKYLVASDLYNPNAETSEGRKYCVGFQNHCLRSTNARYVWKITDDIFDGLSVFICATYNQGHKHDKHAA